MRLAGNAACMVKLEIHIKFCSVNLKGPLGRFRCCVHLQGEDGSSMALRNVGILPQHLHGVITQKTSTLHPEDGGSMDF